MNKLILSMMIIGLPTLLTACATAPTTPSIDELTSAGGEIVDVRELIGDTGVTFVATNGDWFNYLGPDGRKVAHIKKTGVLKELTWRVNDSDQFCQQMFATEEEACDNLVLIRDKDGIYNSYNKENNKPGSPFTIVSGNPEKF